MSLTSKKVRRMEREAILRGKEFDYKREQSAHLLTNSYRDVDDDENDRHRRYDMMRQTRSIHREIEHQVGVMDKINDRKKQELQKRQTPTVTPTPRNYLSSFSSASSIAAPTSLLTDRPYRANAPTEKYTSSKHSSAGKFS